MKKSIKIILTIIILILIGVGILYYILIPNEKIEQKSSSKITTMEDVIQNSDINKFQILKSPLRLQGQISISDNELQNIIYTAINQYNIEDLKSINVNIKDNKVRLTYPYKVFGFIDSQIEVNLIPKVYENELNLLITEAKIGKIKISDKTLEKVIKSYRDTIPFELENNTIIIDKSYTYPTTITNVDINEEYITLDLEIQADNLIDFITKYKINVK